MKTLKDIMAERAKRLTEWRKKYRAGHSRDAVSRMGNFSRATYEALENGRRDITEEWAYELHKRLGVPLNYLLHGGNSPEQFLAPVAFKAIPLLNWGQFGDKVMPFSQLIKQSTEIVHIPPVADLSKNAVALPIGSDRLAPYTAKALAVLDPENNWVPGDLVFAVVYNPTRYVYGTLGQKGFDDGKQVVSIEPYNKAIYDTPVIIVGVTGDILARVMGIFVPF